MQCSITYGNCGTGQQSYLIETYKLQCLNAKRILATVEFKTKQHSQDFPEADLTNIEWESLDSAVNFVHKKMALMLSCDFGNKQEG